MDIEDYHFRESEIPYSNPRSRNECLELMLDDIKKHHSFVISTVDGNYLGEKILSMCNFAVYITAPIEIRIQRIKQRGYDKFGERVRKGGDMYEQELNFHQFVTSRSARPIEQWKESLTYPVICVNGLEDYKKNAVKVACLYDDFFHSKVIS